MKRHVGIACATAVLVHLVASVLYPHSGPFDGNDFKGRIAYSADGNFNDEDDWAASPVALAILAAFGVQDKLVHFDYNCILPDTDPDWEKTHESSVLGAAKRYGYPGSVFFDCQKELEGAIESIKQAINESSADNPLYFILAGPMEVPCLGIERSEPGKRRYVYCISHSRWNDGYAKDDLFTKNKRDVIPTGVTWVQITDQNQFLSTSPYGRPASADEWRPWHWMRDSSDPNVGFLWQQMQVTTRADCSDAGMAYFLMTGDEQTELSKLRKLLDSKTLPAPIDPRPYVRIEAENFRALDGYEVEYRNDRRASQRINVKLAGSASGRIQTPFDEPYTASAGRYDVDVRYFDEKDGRSRLTLYVNAVRQGAVWQASEDDESWRTHTIPDVAIRTGDEIMVEVQRDAGEDGKLDYVQLNYRGPGDGSSDAPVSASSAGGELDDPNALPGQVIVAGSGPGYLKYNGGGPVFLSGPDNPEDFLFRGTLNADGTRSGGGQTEMINRMAEAGVNAFHCQMFRMQVCNIKDEGEDTHCPFVNHDPSQPLDEDVLNQWEGWLDLLEDKGITVHLEFYNDATDVERMGWTLDRDGNLHADERRWIEGIVSRFKHHKNILWGIEESCNKLPRSRTPHFRRIAEVIAQADDHNHPIVQSFVVPDDPEGDFPPDGGTSHDYIGDPNIRVVTWLHVPPHDDDFEAQHQAYLRYYTRDAAKFVVLKNETYHHPRGGSRSRRYMWACAMAGVHTLEAYHHADDAAHEAALRDDGRINTFMERTDFHRMKPRDDLAAGSTHWVLANPPDSYIAYTYGYSGPMGIKDMTAATYDLAWFDTVDGRWVTQRGVAVSSGDVTWSKPGSLGNEVALYVKRRDARSAASDAAANHEQNATVRSRRAPLVFPVICGSPRKVTYS